MITVLGKLPDTAPYLDKPGYNVSAESPDWTPDQGARWLREAFERGDDFLLVSRDGSGVYLRELVRLVILMSDRGLEVTE